MHWACYLWQRAVAALAGHANTSARTFARRFVQETGLTPLQWLLSARLDSARELLESHNIGIDDVARRCGLGTAANLRLHFRRRFATTPTTYRRTFTTSRTAPLSNRGDWNRRSAHRETATGF
jgi:transcriptional regulator GlxA family with amidase domain